VLLSAGEPSGDLHGASLVSALLSRRPDLRLEAFGGPRMAAAGAEVRFPLERYSVMGFAEILGKLPAHFRLLRRLRGELRAGRYALVILIDYPGFNTRLAREAHRAGVRVLYYIAPKYWASGEARARSLQVVDRLAVILPFEPAFFARFGVAAEFVGHPLLDQPVPPARADARRVLRIPPGDRVLALFPGSRRQEVVRLWPAFRDAAQRLLAEGRCQRVVVAGVGGLAYPGAEGFLLRRDDPATIIAAADVALVKSGTATLEAALAGVPMVVAYRVHPVTGWLARRIIRVPWISLVNLIAGEGLVPELTQEQVTPERLTASLAPLLEAGSSKAARQREGFSVLRSRLGGPGASGRVAELALELLG
jgi:lipid-A-disaccharide synthase